MSIIQSGGRLSQWQDGCIAVVCDECGKRQVHRIENLRHVLPMSTPVDVLLEILTTYCRLSNGDACTAELVSPDDGVAVEG